MIAQAALWGLLAASGLLIGAVVAIALGGRLSHRIIAAVMGFGGGVLVAVLSVNLMDSAYREGGPIAATVGFLFGATAFCAINWRLALHGAKNRNRCGDCVKQPSEADHKGSGLAIAVGAVLDGIPESLVIGLSVLAGETISLGLVAGFFLANVPQGLSSATGMKRAGRSNRYIFSLWTAVLLISGIAAAAGYLLLGSRCTGASRYNSRIRGGRGVGYARRIYDSRSVCGRTTFYRIGYGCRLSCGVPDYKSNCLD